MIEVEKTDSPKRETGAPNERPVNDSPVLRWRVAGKSRLNGLVDLGLTTVARDRRRSGEADAADERRGRLRRENMAVVGGVVVADLVAGEVVRERRVLELSEIREETREQFSSLAAMLPKSSGWGALT